MVFDIHGSLSVLALVASAFSLVPPPENVTVSCHNFQTTVYWNYSRPHPQTSFKLNISASDAGFVNVSVTDEHRSYDLTSFVWESEKRFSAFQSVTVSAAEGKHESKMVESTFTFNELKTAKQCELDFPPVSLSMKGLDATVRFDNPHHYYETMKTMKLKQAYSAREFVFTVHLLNDGQQEIFRSEASVECPNEICTYSFSCPEMEKYCITLEGLMKGSNYGVPFKKTDPICATDKEDTAGIYTIFVVVVLTVFVIGVGVVLLINVMTKTWKMIPSSLPKALKMPMDSSKYGNVMNIPYESVSTISFTEPDFNKSDSSLMVATEEETDRSESQTYCSRSDPSSPKSIGSEYAEDRLSESSNQDKSKDTYESELCSEEDSVETASVTLDPEEECSSGYDRPHRLEVDVVDMGHGDVVKCYNRRC